VEPSSVDFNEGDIDIYNRYITMFRGTERPSEYNKKQTKADRDTNLVATSLWCNK
jgi:hypothetical protein